MTARIFLWAAALVIFVAGLLPLFFMVGASLFSNGNLNLAPYHELFHSGRQLLLLKNSLALSALVAVIATTLGVCLAILLGKCNLPSRSVLIFAFTIPFLVPPYIFALAWNEALTPGGILSLLVPEPWLEGLQAGLFTIWGAALVMSTVYLPVVMLLVMAFLHTVKPGVEEAARLCTPWHGVLTRVTLPLVLPGIAFCFLLVFVLTLGEYSVPSYLRYPVYPVEAFTQFSAMYDFKAATAASLPIGAVALIVLLVEIVLLYKKGTGLEVQPHAQGFLTIDLGRFAWPFAIILWGICVVVVLLPILALFYRAMTPGILEDVLEIGARPLVRSLVFAIIGGSILTVTGFLAAYLIKNRAIWSWWLVDMSSFLLFAIPGAVLAIGLIQLWNTRWTGSIYGTMWMVIIGYVARYYFVATRIMLVQLGAISKSMEEAAQLAGAGWIQRVAYILVPLSRKGLLAAWLCSFLFCLRDIDITMLVYPPGADTLPVRIFTVMANGRPEVVAGLCMLMVASVTLPATFLWRHFTSSKKVMP
ncbi:MAG: iron ABC transporter permease [Thermodesulfobacteria bacterium]|nr:iron ABC transporter permease [Thermodesulfobacteriota bacterium]